MSNPVENQETESLLNPEYLKKLLFRRVVIRTLIVSLVTAGIVRCLIAANGLSHAIFWTLIISVFVVVLYGLGRLSNRLICRQLLPSDESIDQFIQQILQLPVQKGIESFLLACLSAIICTAVLVFFFGLDYTKMYIPLVAWLFMSIVTGITAYLETNLVTTKTLEELIRQQGEGIRGIINGYRNRKFMGVSLHNNYFFCVLVPIILTFVMIVFLMVEDQLVEDYNLPARMVAMGVLCLINVIFNTVVFFRDLMNTGHKIETVVQRVLDGEEYSAVETECSSEIGYTAYLVNHIHLKTAEDRKKQAEKKEQLSAKQQSMENLYPQILQSIDDGIQIIDTELGILEHFSDKNEAITVRIKEARTVARKTADTVGESQKSLKQNIQKMQEIAGANRIATTGIQSLSNKISGIWEIVDLIDSIADQTTIIAFNAELEAEKINQNKDKFKNVAYAIRNLTDQVLDLTGKIRSDIKKIQEASTVLLDQGRDNTEYIENGAAITDRLSYTLQMMDSGAADSAELADAVRVTSENFTTRVTALQKQLSKCREYLENYKETISVESELAEKAGYVLGVEE